MFLENTVQFFRLVGFGFLHREWSSWAIELLARRWLEQVGQIVIWYSALLRSRSEDTNKALVDGTF